MCFFLHLIARRSKDLADRFVDVEPVLAWRCFPGEGANPRDDFAGAMAFFDDAGEGLARLIEVRRLAGEPAQRGAGVGDDGGERLINFMSD